MNDPNAMWMKRYGTKDVFLEKEAGLPPYAGRMAAVLLARAMAHGASGPATRRQQMEAAAMNAQFRAIEHAMLEPSLEAMDHTRVPLFVQPGSDLPAGWDEGMVRLASIARGVGADMAKLAFTALPSTLPGKKIQTGPSLRPMTSPGGPVSAVTPHAPVSMPAPNPGVRTPPGPGASQFPTNVGGRPAPSPSAGVTPVMPVQPMGGGRRPINPTLDGAHEIHQSFAQLDPKVKDVIMNHPLVSGGHLPPQAAYQIAYMSHDRSTPMTADSVAKVMSAGQSAPPKGSASAGTPAPPSSPPSFRPTAFGATAPGMAPPSSSPPSNTPPPAARPVGPPPAQQAPVASAPATAPAAPAPAPAASAGGGLLPKGTMGSALRWGAAGAGLYGAMRGAEALGNWGAQEAGPQSYAQPGMYQVPMGVNQYGQPQPGSPLY